MIYAPRFLYKIRRMAKLSNDHSRTLWHTLRFSKAEKDAIQKLAKQTRSKTVSGYIRAAALNRRDDGVVFRDILNEQIKFNAEIKAVITPEEKRQVLERWMLWVMNQQ
jgi:predicted RNA-binding protein